MWFETNQDQMHGWRSTTVEILMWFETERALDAREHLQQ